MTTKKTDMMKKLLGLSTTMPLGSGTGQPPSGGFFGANVTGSHLHSHSHGAGCGCHHSHEEEEE